MESVISIEHSKLDCLIDQKEAVRYLGYGKEEPTPEIMEELFLCSDRLLAAMHPRFQYCFGDIFKNTESKTKQQEEILVCFENKTLLLPGRSIQEHLSGCEAVLGACLTLGEEVDHQLEALQQESMLSALLFDALANAAVEQLRFLLEEQAAQKLKEWRLNWLFGIGYGDLPLTLQKDFLETVNAEEKIGLSCNEKSVLFPTKSVTGFIGLKKNKADLEQQKNRDSCGRKKCDLCSQRDICMFSDRKRP